MASKQKGISQTYLAKIYKNLQYNMRLCLKLKTTEIRNLKGNLHIFGHRRKDLVTSNKPEQKSK